MDKGVMQSEEGSRGKDWITSEVCLVLGGWIDSKMCGVKGMDERIDEGVLLLFGHVERDRIAKRVYVGEWGGSRSVGSPWKRWIDSVKECLGKRGLDVRQVRRMVQDRSEWWGFMRGST